MRTRSFRVWNEVVERGAVTKSRKRKKASVERKVGECFQWRAHGECSKETHVVSIMNQPLETVAEFTDEMDNCPRPHQIRRPRLTEREKNPQRFRQHGWKLFRQQGKISCRYSNCNNPSCNYWHPPVCQNCKSQTGCNYGNKCYCRHVEAGEKPSKKSKKGGAKDQLLNWRSLYNWIVRLKIPIRENLFYGKKENWDQIAPKNCPQTPGSKKNSGKKGSIASDNPQVCASRV